MVAHTCNANTQAEAGGSLRVQGPRSKTLSQKDKNKNKEGKMRKDQGFSKAKKWETHEHSVKIFEIILQPRCKQYTPEASMH